MQLQVVYSGVALTTKQPVSSQPPEPSETKKNVDVESMSEFSNGPECLPSLFFVKFQKTHDVTLSCQPRNRKQDFKTGKEEY